jgi:hypothetical protein
MVDTLISGEARETLLTATAITHVATVVRETLLAPGSPVSAMVAGVARETLLAPPPPPLVVAGVARETLYSIPSTRVLTWKLGW